ncbi:ISL3 family transposase [Corallococcus aberystwythensis]|uniref:ISL3 family transposase n=1 Tax=Corallococcus aberystwythensis TaxID=2316722 RepID=A0A3A8QMJ9_9BACT|nr:ISL3 family transposase [Corallococcus aberystwythensis]RKH68110.1 ISL3 family transposase [Corallococcus aberystwythensis]
METLYSLPGCRVERVTHGCSAEVVLVGRIEGTGARCPACQMPSSSVHGSYVRRPADLPCAGHAVQLELRVRRFCCRNPECSRRTFAERPVRLLSSRARRTRRLAAAQCSVGVTTGAEAGARLLKPLAMPTSPDTLLRLIRRAPLPLPSPARVLGIDDWALRKGRTYGSILVDLEVHRVRDVLPDRSTPTVSAWLRRHPGVEVIARDRSTEYARAVALGAPDAQQVADRWHLLLNGRQTIERWLTGAHPRLRALPAVSKEDAPPARRHASFPRAHTEVRAREESRAHRIAAYEAVRRRYLAGEPLLRISRTLRLARGTVRKYAAAESFPERAARVPGASILDPYLEYLTQRHVAGCENACALWREIHAQGFHGTSRQVHRWLQTRRTTPSRFGPRRYPGGNWWSPDARPDALASPKQLAWLCTKTPSGLTSTEAATLARIEQDEEAARVVALTRRFCEVVRSRGVSHGATPTKSCWPFEAWLGEARRCGVRAVETFAEGLEQDGAAIRAALTTPWSNAQAEGQITKLKLLKRQMYGRADFDLLRHRVLLTV